MWSELPGMIARIEELEAQLEDAKKEIKSAGQAIADLGLQCKFWRRAAECAIDGWNKLEERHEDLVERVRALLKSEPSDADSEAWRQLELHEDVRAEPSEPTPNPDLG